MSVKTTCGGEDKEKIVSEVALMWPKDGTKKRRRRKEGGTKDRRGRDLTLTEQCPCYGQMYCTGCSTGGQSVNIPCTVLCTIRVAFYVTFPDSYCGKVDALR